MLIKVKQQLCVHHRAPKLITTAEYAGIANYAYHLDAGKFARFLCKHCVNQLGVKHVLDHVQRVNAASNGDIQSLQTAKHGDLCGDLFVDCSGSLVLLIGQHYQVPLHSKKSLLLIDTALAVQVPNEHENSEIASHTISTAQKSGWIWDIGLPSRRGVGHVYSGQSS